jgi:hypothetical protein
VEQNSKEPPETYPLPHLIPMEPYKSMPQSIKENENSIIPMVYNLQATSKNYNLIHNEYLPSCIIDLSTDPYVNKHTIELQNKGNHPT